MSPAKRDAIQQANARLCLCLQAQDRLARDRLRAQHAVEVVEQALQTWASLQTSWPRSKAV